MVEISVQIGYESHTLSVSSEEWNLIKSGKPFEKILESYYEGESFTYEFNFNSDPENNLIVNYYGADLDRGEGYIGSIEGAKIEFLD